ncbi:BMP family lipoprotein [Haploplasma axanthum]|uniref:Purine nucleoside receptor A n=1 Tax=Haploplasma axanthum TaxID=29552 RepID=A0A449BBE9_HAPAX|nr:BMP family ABC transporter substrate-binding protein [Haploplasma axanthum]VEU79719.1 Purine nucleoside receptor A [Haploplasma axanthum]
MKKVLTVVSVFLLGLFLVSCSDNKKSEWNILMITDVGTITDKSFNQGTWEGVEAFTKKHDNVKSEYYRPTAGTKAEYLQAIDLAVGNGANVIVTPGYLFETAIFEAQKTYPDVYFILIDGEPHNDDYSVYETKKNTVNILFQEEQSGFLAGYAAVADGFTKLGFMGGMEVPAVQKFGIGYVAGAYYAANELEKTITFPANRYEYLGDFDNKPEHTTKAESWYASDTDIIFASAGGAGNAVMKAAENRSKKVIGVDVDQSSQSNTVISSAMKQLGNAVDQVLTELIVDDAWKGGTTITKGAAEDAVGLPLGTSFKWTTFTTSQYNTIFDSLKNKTIVVPSTKAQLATFLNEKAGNPSVSALVDKTETK